MSLDIYKNSIKQHASHSDENKIQRRNSKLELEASLVASRILRTKQNHILPPKIQGTLENQQPNKTMPKINK